jgi:hypothetical protein
VDRRVKGTLFVDYVRMLRGRKDIDWAQHLMPADVSYLVRRIEPGDWYPMESFERMGLAILAEIAAGDVQTVRAFGRLSTDWLVQQHPTLIAPGDPRDSLMRFQVLRRGFFDYPALELTSVSDGEATLRVSYGMSPPAEEAASWQTLGFFERLLDVAGASEVEAWFSARSWAAEVQLRWKDPVSSPPP